MHSALAINPKTGAVDPNGVRLTASHMHQALQDYLGIGPTNPALGFGVPMAERISLFDPNAKTGYPSLTA